MAYDQAVPNTAGVIAAQDAQIQRHLWDKKVEVFEQTHDFFRTFEGKGASFPIQSRMDTSKGAGQKIIFTQKSGLYGRPHIGDELFENSTHFETLRMAANELNVDWFRHGVRLNERTEEKLGLRGELMAGLPDDLGMWLGRLKTSHAFHTMLKKGDSTNYSFLNLRADRNDIRKTDTLSYDAVMQVASVLQTTNGRPAYIGMDGDKNPIHSYVFVSCSDSLFSLKNDPDYRTAHHSAGIRGPENLIFKGGYSRIDGSIIREYTAIDHDGAGPVGSAINPKAELGVAITAANTAQAIKGGGYSAVASLDRVDYFQDFPNFAFRFSPDDIVDVSTPETFYVAIVNRSGANAGKFGFYQCSTNSGGQLTMTKRLRATGSTSGSDIAYTQIGQVVWDDDKNTDAHPEGSLVMLCSAYGAPIGYTIAMGSAAMRRGYGMYTRQRAEQRHEGGFVKDVFIKSVFGQALRRDVRNRAPGLHVVCHAISYPGLVFNPTLAS